MAFQINTTGIKGNVTYNKDIVLKVIKLAVSEIDGVTELMNTFYMDILKPVNSNYTNGVKINFKDNMLVVNIFISVYYNINVSEVAYKIQENVKNSLNNVLNIETEKINVNVLGVNFKLATN